MQNKYIPLKECKDGFLYIIDARNARIGVFELSSEGFKISRDKFGSNFIFIEYHWDTGEPFGTVMPLKEIGQVEVMDDNKLLEFLNKKAIELKEEIDLVNECK